MIRYISFFLIFAICLSRSEENLNTNNGHNNKPVIIEISHNEKKLEKSNKNKKIIPSLSSVILLVISTSLLYAFGKSIYSYFNMSAQINEISGRTSDIYKTQTLHTTLLEEAKTTLEKNKAKLNDLSIEIKKIGNTQLEDSKKIQQTLASITVLEENITTLSNTIDNHHTENSDSFGEISTKINDLQLKLARLLPDLEKLIDKKLQNLDETIKSNQETIKSNQEDTNNQLKSILEAVTKPNP